MSSQIHVPSYRLHRQSGQAVVTLSARDFYLGKHGSAESHAEYQRLVGEFLASGRLLPPSHTARICVNQLMVAYLEYAQVRYVRDGKPTRELETMKYAFRPLKSLYGHIEAATFGPRALKAVQSAMISSNLKHRVINQRIGYVKRMFKWGSEQELIPPTVYHGLLCVRGLSYGEMGVRNSEPVKPVPEQYVRAILPFLPPTLGAMVQVQWLTGMRSGELVAMRGIEIDMSGNVWLYRPARHKTARFGREKIVPLGPQCREILTPFLTLNPFQHLFSPAKAQIERMEAKRARRVTKVQPSQKDRRKADSKRKPGSSYNSRSYHAALQYAMAAAVKAGSLTEAEFWHPHQLRHSAALRIQRSHGLEAARAVLGHIKADMTALYAGIDATLATRVAVDSA